jgi:hypothetical protein
MKHYLGVVGIILVLEVGKKILISKKWKDRMPS